MVLPLHPRTRQRLVGRSSPAGLRLVEPLEYLEFVALQAQARMVVTDSGGVQEETSALGIPCITYRENTERPVTVERGTNRLVGMDPGALLSAARDVLAGRHPTPRTSIPLWDGRAGSRAAAAVTALLDGAIPRLAAPASVWQEAA